MKPRQKASDVAFTLMNYAVMTLFALACVIPFYYLFINTISDNNLSARGLITFLPKGVHLDNYVKILGIQGLANSAMVSLGRTVIGTMLTIIGTSFLGYAVSKPELWLRKVWYRLIVVTLYFNAGIIPWYINMKNLGLINNFLAYILPSVISPFLLMLFKTYVENIPASLEESADLDGAGYLAKYICLIIPLSKPILATLVVFSAVNQWNAFTDTLFLVTNPKLFSLQYMLFQYLNESSNLAAQLREASKMGQTVNLSSLLTPTSVKMTVSMIVVLPVLAVYPFFQKYFVNGILIGAVKG